MAATLDRTALRIRTLLLRRELNVFHAIELQRAFGLAKLPPPDLVDTLGEFVWLKATLRKALAERN